MENEVVDEGICVSCGMCCDGTLFSRVLVQDDDVSSYHALGVMEIEDRTVFPQPCCALDGARWTIYASRPSSCRSFSCNLLQAHERGEVSRSTALQRIQQAHVLRDQVVRTLENHPSYDRAQSLRINARKVLDSEAAQVEHAQTAIRYAALKVVLHKHFLAPTETTE